VDRHRAGAGRTLDARVRQLVTDPLEAERTCLGAVLVDNVCIEGLAEIVRVEHFENALHREMYRAMLAMHERSERIDPVTLRAEMGSLDGVFLGQLLDIPRISNVDEWARIVREAARRRALVKLGSQVEAWTNEAGDVDAVIDRLQQALHRIHEGGNERRFEVSMREAVDGALKLIDRSATVADGVTGVPTGFPRLDEITGGLQPGHVYTLGARPGRGKSALSTQIAIHAAGTGRRVLAFTLEMLPEQVMQRALMGEARVEKYDLRRGETAAWSRLLQTSEAMKLRPVEFDRHETPTLQHIKTHAARMARTDGLDLVVIDYFQRCAVSTKSDRWQALGELARGIKSLAQSMCVPVLLPAQLNRNAEDKRPTLADLRECVAAGTRIQVASGRRVAVEVLANEAVATVASVGADLRLGSQRAQAWPVGVRRCLEIKLATGRSLVVTENHRLKTVLGWDSADSLAVGSRVAIARRIAEPQPEHQARWSQDAIGLLGHLVGDGSYATGSVRYASASEGNLAYVTHAAEREFGCKVTRYESSSCRQLLLAGKGTRWRAPRILSWLRSLGIFGQRSHEKHFPEEVFAFSNADVAQLLRHMWSTDGTACVGKRRASVAYATNSARLANEVADLLLRFGIVARIWKASKHGYRDGLIVAIQSADQMRLFAERIGAFGERIGQLQRVVASISRGSHTNNDTIPREIWPRVRQLLRERGISQREMAKRRGTSYGGTSHFKYDPSRATLATYADALGDAEIRSLAESDLFWDRIVSIVPAGERMVYDLSVERDHCYLANGVLSHNCGDLEQESDMVAFLHPTPMPGKSADELMRLDYPSVDLIVEKFRSGERSMIPLSFARKYVRFESGGSVDEHGQPFGEFK
jgi:replicative DNA helicase